MKKKTATRRSRSRVIPTRRLARSAGVFAIMLDNLVRVHPNHFPITATGSIERLRVTSQHNGTFRLIPRGTSSADLRENKDLINTVTSQIDEGGIYFITVR